MKPLLRLLLCAAPLVFSACSTPQSRIEKNQTVYGSFPADVQRKISAGRVDIGFTAEMVEMALGKPVRKFTRKTEEGDVEVWGYHGSTPRISFGIGLGLGGRHSSVGGGVALSTGDYDPDEKLRVEFRDGRVTAIDSLDK